MTHVIPGTEGSHRLRIGKKSRPIQLHVVYFGTDCEGMLADDQDSWAAAPVNVIVGTQTYGRCVLRRSPHDYPEQYFDGTNTNWLHVKLEFDQLDASYT